MADKKTTTKTTTRTTSRKTTGKSWLIRACSYLALVIAAFVFVLGGIFNACNLGSVVGVFNLIGQICLLIGIGIPAYDYTRGKPIAWRVVYWVALIIYVLGCILGLL